MTAQLSPQPRFQAFGNNGQFLVGGKLFTYGAGTSAPQATYIDSTQTTPNTNPIVLDALGSAPVWLDPTKSYKYVLQDASGNPIYTTDNINGALGVGSNVVSFGADPTGVADSTAAINACIAAVNAAGTGVVNYPAGSYLVGSLGVYVNYVLGSILHQGASRDGTVIINGSTNQPAIQCGNGVTQIYGGGIRNMRFTQKAGVTATSGNTAFTYSLVGQFLIDNVFVSNALGAPFRGAYFTGSSTTGCSQHVIYNLEVQGCLNDGITNILGLDSYVTDSRSDANGGSGWVLNASQGGYYKACTGFGNSAVAWDLASTTPASAVNKNLFFSQCIGDTSGSYNWQILDAQNCYWFGGWGSSQLNIAVNTFATGLVIATQFCKSLFFFGSAFNNNNSHGVQILDTGASAPVDIHLYGCQYGSIANGANGNGQSGAAAYGLTFNGNTNHIRVNGGSFAGNLTGAILNQSAQSDITISGNPTGFVSTNQGTGTVTTTATSVVITHGLSFTPNLINIQITDISSKAASGINSAWTSAPTATTFTVNTNVAVAGASYLFVWRASYNGS